MTASPVDHVVDVFQKWLYLPKPEALLAVLGTLAANRMQGDPVWLLVVGPPGGGKSEILQSTLGLRETRPAATLTERALLSGTAKKEQEPGAKGGVLREIGKYGILVCKDFGSILSMHREERGRTLAALREIYDGSWTRPVGVDGGRTLHWEGKVGLIAGCTPAIDSHHAVMGAMGERFLLFRLPQAERNAQARRALSHRGREAEMRAELVDSVNTLFRKAQPEPRAPTTAEDDRLIALATLVACCRSSVERDSYKRDIILVPGSEAPTRIAIALASLLAGLDVLGVDREQAWDVVVQVGLDSMPRLRHDILLMLYDADDPPNTSEIAVEVRHPKTTTERGLEDLTAHYVTERLGQGQGKTTKWEMSDWAKKGLSQALRATSPEMSHPIKDLTSPVMSDSLGSQSDSSSSWLKAAWDDKTGEVGDSSENGTGQQSLVPVPEDAGPPDTEPDPTETDW